MIVPVRLLRAALLVAAVAVSACGKRGDPLPPIRPVPGRIVDLVARRIDDRVELRFTVPATNNDGTTPPLIDRIEIYRTMSTEDATAPSAVVLLNRKNLIGQITVRRPPPPEATSDTAKTPAEKSAKSAKPEKPLATPPGAVPGPAPGELAIYTDSTPTDSMPASAMRHYMLVAWAGTQQQRSTRLEVSMASYVPPRPVEQLAATFDETAIKISWVGPPLLFLPIERLGSPLPIGMLPPPAHVEPGTLPIAQMPKPSVMPATPAIGAAPGTAVPTTPGQPPAPGVLTANPPPPPTTTPGFLPPSRTGSTGALPPATTPDQTRGTFGLPGAGAAGGVGRTGGLGLGMGTAPAVSIGIVRGYRVTEVDESGHELTPNGPLATPIPASLDTLPVAFDKTRCFVVRTVDTKGSVVVESTASEPVCVTPKDTFPPPAPTELRAFPSETGVVLTWTGVEAADLAGYVVLRGEGAGDNMTPLNATPMSETTFSDTTVKSGVTYVYAVIAVDSSPQHNPSAQSNRQTIVAR